MSAVDTRKEGVETNTGSYPLDDWKGRGNFSSLKEVKSVTP